ncbi:hypothetical protein NECID01_2084 [Nematocida sp. AWRm77]|nr:hypothetical protein NECID01_2084 [Nematocida sp. AWRm77]
MIEREDNDKKNRIKARREAMVSMEKAMAECEINLAPKTPTRLAQFWKRVKDIDTDEILVPCLVSWLVYLLTLSVIIGGGILKHLLDVLEHFGGNPTGIALGRIGQYSIYVCLVYTMVCIYKYHGRYLRKFYWKKFPRCREVFFILLVICSVGSGFLTCSSMAKEVVYRGIVWSFYISTFMLYLLVWFVVWIGEDYFWLLKTSRLDLYVFVFSIVVFLYVFPFLVEALRGTEYNWEEAYMHV